jgi:hypothetical protein
VHAYASRTAADDRTRVIIVNYTRNIQKLTFEVTDLAVDVAPATFELPSHSMSAVEIPDDGEPKAWTYGSAEWQAGTGPRSLP